MASDHRNHKVPTHPGGRCPHGRSPNRLCSVLRRCCHGRSSHAVQKLTWAKPACSQAVLRRRLRVSFSVVTKNRKPLFLQLGEFTIPLWSARLFKSTAMLAGGARSVPAMLPAQCCAHCSQMICLPPRARFAFDVVREFLEHLFIGFGSCVFSGD